MGGLFMRVFSNVTITYQGFFFILFVKFELRVKKLFFVFSYV